MGLGLVRVVGDRKGDGVAHGVEKGRGGARGGIINGPCEGGIREGLLAVFPERLEGSLAPEMRRPVLRL